VQEPLNVFERMKQDWNQRAREDAHFYVAFGRRQQDDDEFFATASQIVRSFETELRRLPVNANRREWRALEIGCGPGRLLKPMSRHFGEIHGVDVSDEMIVRARGNLLNVPHAHAHATSGSDLAPFADSSFDFVYSYAVFQHIPSRDVVMQYLREANRVLKPGGLLRCQINGLDKTAKTYDTWSGVRISADEVREYALQHDMQLLALEGVRTQYMWTTMRKRMPGWRDSRSGGRARIRRITNAHNSEPVVPLRGRYASFTLWLEGLPADCDLIDFEASVGGVRSAVCYIGPPEWDGLQQVNVLLTNLDRTGVLPLELRWKGATLCGPAGLRVIPPGPFVPAIVSVTDGIDMLAGTQVFSGTVKVSIEEADRPETFEAELGGRPVPVIDVFCVDPFVPRHEINFQVPADLPSGSYELRMRLGRRRLGSTVLEVIRS
jgi:ubiquinone/menaquinone biosynthesis C-methylase UbiE